MSKTIEQIDPAQPAQDAVKIADLEIAEFVKFFESELKQNPPDPYEKAFLKTYLMYRLIGPDRMVQEMKKAR